MAEISEADQVKIATGFLMNAPAGEFMEVVTDLRSLLPRESMLNDTANETFRAYNHDQLIQVESPDKSHLFLISKHGEVAPGSNQYLDCAAGQVHTFDHIKGAVTASRAFQPGKDSDSGAEGLRAQLEKQVQNYVAEQFPFGSYGVFAPASEAGTIYICISSTKLNPQNFCNGRWRSVWTVAKSGAISGHIKLQVHYFEDGNVQLHTDTAKKLPAAGTDAAAIVKAIAKAEQTFQSSLDASYGIMNETTLKALRRALPISGQKINWNLIQSYKLGSQMEGQAK